MKTKIIFLTKFPEPGKVKSRLSKEIGAFQAAEIYKNVLLDNWQNAKETAHKISIEYSPPESLFGFQELFGENTEFHPQTGNDIGWRMANAFERYFQQQFDAVVLIGGDTPELSVDLFNRVFNSLIDHDIVLGPAYDGGYYLIGFKKVSFNPKYFQNIDWSTDQVFNQTIEIIRNSVNKLYLLEKRIDLDTFDDVKEYLGSTKRKSGIAQKIQEILGSEDFYEDKVDDDTDDNTSSGICPDRDI
jgi:uncharacterized protein